MKEWQKYKPTFNHSEFCELQPGCASASAWNGHVSFGYDLIRFMEPNIVVELGTHFGNSFFVFCQGVSDAKSMGRVVAIDSWEGDFQAGFYSEDVYEYVQRVKDQLYPNYSVMIRSYFDDAVELFDDNSIDFLHIDGLHTYEAVWNDFTRWLPKLAPNGVVLFHDIAIMYGQFGVYRFWAELRSMFPHLEFYHSAGLGILFPKGIDDRGRYFLENKEGIQKMYP